VNIETIVKQAVAGGLDKTASAQPVSYDDVITGIEKQAAAVTDETALGLVKAATAALRQAMSELSKQASDIAEMQKVSSVRAEVDRMLADGVITPYEVHEKVAELVKSPDVPAFTGKLLVSEQKVASLGKRGMFDDVLNA